MAKATRDMSSGLPAQVLADIQQGTLGYHYKGVPCLKNPFDLCLYMKLIYELQPRTILEIGSAAGGSAIWFADMQQNYGIEGEVVSIDLKRVRGVEHPRVRFLQGDATSLQGTLDQEFLSSLPRPWLVIEDAAHTYDVTMAVLNFFLAQLRVGEYIIVEDGIVNDLPGEVYAA